MSRSGFRREACVTEADLRNLGVPTLVPWGDHDPVGSADAARRIQAPIPHAELHVVHGGHAPWLGQATQIATALVDWVPRLHT